MLFSTLIIAAMPTEAEAAIYEDTIRLHILAASDSKEDQNLKLELRDELLKKYGNELEASADIESAKEKIEALIPEIESFMANEIKARGFSYPVKVTLTEEWYDTRNYEEFTLPSGNYTSLRVIIDDGDGQNWWCVMFPPLCLDIATEKAPADDAIKNYSKEEISLITSEKYTVKFKILELLSGAFR